MNTKCKPFPLAELIVGWVPLQPNIVASLGSSRRRAWDLVLGSSACVKNVNSSVGQPESSLFPVEILTEAWPALQSGLDLPDACDGPPRDGTDQVDKRAGKA